MSNKSHQPSPPRDRQDQLNEKPKPRPEQARDTGGSGKKPTDGENAQGGKRPGTERG